ncbi:hypothetical protein HYY72_02085 [Candidatus Woesearchaeota archaeon]|nr:hypothetical protein [Candidatus Woesearchaeota archaeon]
MKKEAEMFQNVIDLLKKVTFFEKAVLIIGLFTIAIGFYFIQRIYVIDQQLSWLMLIAIFSWLSLLLLIIISSLNANVKEELSEVIRESADETRLLKEITHQLLDEIKLLRKGVKK